MTRWLVTAMICALTATTAEARIQVSDDMHLRDKDGTTYMVVIDCPQPGVKKDAGKFFGGSEHSTIGKDRCGKCLIDANWGVYLKHPYDVLIKGKLADENEKPIKNKLVHFFLPNGWTVKTRTADSGYFRIVMGATAERKSRELLEMDLGTRHMKKESAAPFYAFYVLPQSFKACEAQKKD